VPFNSQPIVESLKRKLGLFAYLQFHHDQSPFPSRFQQIDKRPLLASIRWDLRVNETRIERRIERGNVSREDRLEPALGLITKSHLVAELGFRTAAGDRFSNQFLEFEFVCVIELDSRVADSKFDTLAIDQHSRDLEPSYRQRNPRA